jgi:hypothetical protein
MHEYLCVELASTFFRWKNFTNLKHEQTKVFERIKKLGTTFLNAQQMFVQQVVHI